MLPLHSLFLSLTPLFALLIFFKIKHIQMNKKTVKRKLNYMLNDNEINQ